MPQFFIKASDIFSNKYIIEGKDCHHLQKVRRVKPGDLIDLRGDDGILYKGRLIEVHPKSIMIEIIESFMNNKIDIHLSLYTGILKGKMFDFVLQKAVEIGVERIVPVITERTVPIIDKSNNKRTRWEKIVASASKQCMRSNIPIVEDVLTFKEAITDSSSQIKIIAHPDAKGKNIRDLFQSKTVNDISLFVGPEGGFSEKELIVAGENNWEHIVFGFTSLRAETAVIVLTAIIIHEWSEWSNIREDHR